MRVMKQLLAEHRRVSLVLAGALIGLLLVTISNLFAGLPDPRQPAPDLFDNPDPTSWALRDETGEALTVFSERPLFSATRRTKVRPSDPKAEPKPEPASPVLTLDNWSLLGIFDSGEVEGALIRHPSSGRHRLVVGERVDGWELTSVDPRSVRFKSVAGGSQAELKMALATVTVLPVPSNKGSTTGTATSTVKMLPAPSNKGGITGAATSTVEQKLEAAEAAEVPENSTPSFGEFYGGSAEKGE